MMTQPPRRREPHRTIFIGLALVLAAIVIFFAFSSIPSALRPTESPTTSNVNPAGH